MSQATDVFLILVESKPESGRSEAFERGVGSALAVARCAVMGLAHEAGDTHAERLERDGDEVHRVPRQRKRMQTITFRQQGLPIGSGTVEAATKVFVAQRRGRTTSSRFGESSRNMRATDAGNR